MITKEKDFIYVLDFKHKLVNIDDKLDVWSLVSSTDPLIEENAHGVQSISLGALRLMAGTVVVDKSIKKIKKFRGKILFQLGKL